MTIRMTLWRLVRTMTWVKRGQRVRANGGPVKVNLGSGLSAAEGWINVDGGVHAMCSRWPPSLLRWVYKNSDCRNTHSIDEYLQLLGQRQFVHHGLEYGVPCSDGTVDFIYSSHALEHLFKEDAEKLLRDAYRALKPGGRLRIAVPDLEYAMSLYQNGAKEQALAFFFTPQRAGYLNHHHFMYDYDVLSGLLAAVGFVEIKRSAFQEGSFPDVKTLDNRPEETLFVEAKK